MPESLENTNSLELWSSLHDGGIESIESDLMARSLTFVVDSPFHWEFHGLPVKTRFRILCENVRVAEAYSFDPWPGAKEPIRETPQREAEEQRRRDYEKGRTISTDWKTFVTRIESGEDYEILNAELHIGELFFILNLGVLGPRSDYLDLKIRAERFRFSVGERELRVDEFQKFGAEYWEAWAEKAKASQTSSAQ